MKYRKYPEAVRLEISRTGNIHLFPGHNIPRTTAQYWVKTKKRRNPILLAENSKLLSTEREGLKQALEKERALTTLLKAIRSIFPYDFQRKRVTCKSTRQRIVAAIQACLKFHNLDFCLQLVGLSKSAYQRWRCENSFCRAAKTVLGRRTLSQLTEQEVKIMKTYLTSKKYAHLSIPSLHWLAQREGLLFCCLETWYKYFRHFEWKRPWQKIKRIFRREGVRATRANEIWHVDVTLITTHDRKKVYLQAVVDNFSRYVLAWAITDKIGSHETVALLDRAKWRAQKSQIPSTIYMDSGTENKNKIAERWIHSNNMARVLARVETQYSNSMVESLFRTLKSNYLCHQSVRDSSDLKRKVNFFIRQYNSKIPLAALEGGSPSEVYNSTWSEDSRRHLKEQRQEAQMMRRKDNSHCHPCTEFGAPGQT